MRRSTQGIGLLALCVALLGPSLALAQTADPAARAAARDLGYQGVKAYQNADYSTAVDRLSRAYQVLKVPSLGLWLGRSLAQQGKLVEASELFLEVSRLSISGGDEAVQKRAQDDASKERVALQRRIAKLGVTVTGPDSAAAKVTVDDREVPAALLGVQSPTNPGSHVVVARSSNGTTARREVVLAEGGAQTVSLQLSATKPTSGLSSSEPAAKTTPVAQPGATPATPDTPPEGSVPLPPPPTTEVKRPVPKWVGYSALALGGLGIAAGSILGLKAQSDRHAPPLSQGCTGNKCSPSVGSALGDYNQLRGLSTVGFGVGAVGLVAGVVLLWVLPDVKVRERPVAFSVQTTRETQRIVVDFAF